MPQPTYGDVHVDTALTNISTAYIQSAKHYIADQVFPKVPVQHKSDVYFKWSKDDFYRDDVGQRADGQISTGGGVTLAQGNYSAKVYGRHMDIGDQIRANQDAAIDIDITVTRAITQKQLIRRDAIFVANYMTTGKWGNEVAGASAGNGTTTRTYWSDDAGGDPFTDVSDAQSAILGTTGMEPNVLVLGFPVRQALRKHPLLIDRIKITLGVSQADALGLARNITDELLAAAFDVDKVVVAKAVSNTAAEGATANTGFILGKHALLAYAAPAPGLMIPSAGYIFPWEGLTGLNTEGIVVWQDRLPGLGRNTIRIDSDMAFDMQIVGADLGYFFNGIVQ